MRKTRDGSNGRLCCCCLPTNGPESFGQLFASSALPSCRRPPPSQISHELPRDRPLTTTTSPSRPRPSHRKPTLLPSLFLFRRILLGSNIRAPALPPCSGDSRRNSSRSVVRIVGHCLSLIRTPSPFIFRFCPLSRPSKSPAPRIRSLVAEETKSHTPRRRYVPRHLVLEPSAINPPPPGALVIPTRGLHRVRSPSWCSAYPFLIQIVQRPTRYHIPAISPIAKVSPVLILRDLETTIQGC